MTPTDDEIIQYLPIAKLTNKPQVWLTQQDAIAAIRRALLAEQATKEAGEDAELLERAFFALDNYRAAIHYAQDKAALMSAIKAADSEAGLVMSAIRAARAAERKA